MLSAALLCVSLLLGGGNEPIFTAVIELLAALLIAWLIATPAELGRGHGMALLVCLAIVAIPLGQLVPLSPGASLAFPGREIAGTIATTGGTGMISAPLSLDPDATLRALLATLPGLALFIATLRASLDERRQLLLIVAAGATLSAVLGALQIAGGSIFDLFTTAHAENAIGLFANRNHQADLLMIGMLAAAATAGTEPRARALAGGLAVLFAIAVLATTSRMGTLLLPFALLGTLAVLSAKSAGSRRVIVIGMAALVVVAALLLWRNAVVQHTLARFDTVEDGRYGFWVDTLVAIRRSWPIGTGLGSFVPVFASQETLDHVQPLYVNHAHNDYLELVLETGFLGVVVAISAALVAIYGLLGTNLSGSRSRRAAVIGVAILLLHSLVDYPLRMLSLSTVFGLLVGLFFSTTVREKRVRILSRHVSKRHAAPR